MRNSKSLSGSAPPVGHEDSAIAKKQLVMIWSSVIAEAKDSLEQMSLRFSRSGPAFSEASTATSSSLRIGSSAS